MACTYPPCTYPSISMPLDGWLLPSEALEICAMAEVLIGHVMDERGRVVDIINNWVSGSDLIHLIQSGQLCNDTDIIVVDQIAHNGTTIRYSDDGTIDAIFNP